MCSSHSRVGGWAVLGPSKWISAAAAPTLDLSAEQTGGISVEAKKKKKCLQLKFHYLTSEGLQLLLPPTEQLGEEFCGGWPR